MFFKQIKCQGCILTSNGSDIQSELAQGLTLTEKKVRRIIKLSELEGTFKVHLVQCLCNKQGHLQLDQGAQSPSSLTLSVFRNGASTTSLGNLFQCFTTLIVEGVFSFFPLSRGRLWVISNSTAVCLVWHLKVGLLKQDFCSGLIIQNRGLDS